MENLNFHSYMANCLTRDTHYIPIFEHHFTNGTHDLVCAPLNYQFPIPSGYKLSGMLKYAKGGFIHIPYADNNDPICELFVIFSRKLDAMTPPYPLWMLRHASMKQESTVLPLIIL
jgi:hypothetical protein